LPVIETSHRDLKMIDAATALGQGFRYAHDWFDQVERTWADRRKDESMSLADRFDYDHLLTDQKPHSEFTVLTNKSGTNLCSAILTSREARQIGPLEIGGFIADSVTYRYYAGSEDEAHYLVGVLNARVVNEAIKPFQSQGLMGERDIHRRPFEICNIPLFNPNNDLHIGIARVSAAARAELLPFASKMPTPVAQARKFARERVAGKLARLDQLTRELLGSLTPAPRLRGEIEAQSTLL
jgi:hypothetical protein